MSFDPRTEEEAMKCWQISYLAACFMIAAAALAGVPWLHRTGQDIAAIAFAGMAVCLVGLGSNLLRRWRRSDTRSGGTSQR
jgi:membrane protein implicated in regulation of membrane protease activity